MRARCLAALLALARLALPAEAATLSGRVELRRTPEPPDPRPGIASLGDGGPRAQPDRTRSVVYLEVAPHPAFELPVGPPVVLDQRDEAFLPYVLAITVGTTVEFPNNDRTYHNVFSLSKARRFDLGRYPRGQSRSVRFDRPGVVRVFCEIHSHMNAFVLVFAHPYFAVTDGEGRYRLDRVPPGEYQLSVWNDGQVRETRPVRVPPEAANVEQDFSLP
jgi:plastocyanin